MKTRTRSLFALMLALCLVLVACSSNDGSDVAQTTDAVPTEPAAVAESDESAPDETPALGAVEQPEPSEPDVPLQVEVDVDINLAPQGIFAGAAAALEALESYRFTTSFLFMGEEDGEVESGSIELSGEIMDAEHKHFVWRNLEDGEHFELCVGGCGRTGDGSRSCDQLGRNRTGRDHMYDRRCAEHTVADRESGRPFRDTAHQLTGGCGNRFIAGADCQRR